MKKIITALVFCFATSAASADELGNAMTGLCEKMKDCALQQMGQQEIPPQMRDMVTAMIAPMCEGIKTQFQASYQAHDLYEPATACIRSMNRLSCEQVQANTRTPECEAYERMAENYSTEP